MAPDEHSHPDQNPHDSSKAPAQEPPVSFRLTETETPFPVLTQEFSPATAPGRADGDLGRLVSQTISDVLGWRTRSQDADGFVAALTGSFDISRVEGHNEVAWTPRGYSVQADLGVVTGGQASLAARARTVVRDALPLLDSLVPLRVDPDTQDAEAFRALVRHGLEEVLTELQSPVVRPDRVDILFDQLTGGSFAGRQGAFAGPDDVSGHLGALREQFGLTRENVNTIDEERIQTSFYTLADWVLSLEESWNRQKGQITLADGGGGFLGTTLVRLSQELAVAAAQVDEVTATLDSVFITAPERQTLLLSRDSSITLEGLLTWIRDLTSFEIQKMIQSGGKDAVEHAVTPLLAKVETLLAEKVLLGLPSPVGTIRLVIDGDITRPAGFHTARVQLALYELYQHVHQARQTAQRVHRNFEVAIDSVQPFLLRREQGQRVVVRGTGLRPDEHTGVLFGPDGSICIADQQAAAQTQVSGITQRLSLVFNLEDKPVGAYQLAIVREGRHLMRGGDPQRFTGKLLDFTHVFVPAASRHPHTTHPADGPEPEAY